MTKEALSAQQRWALFKFTVVSRLLWCPPARGQLAGELRRLAQQEWRHPITGVPLRVGISTIEKWLARARSSPADPLG